MSRNALPESRGWAWLLISGVFFFGAFGVAVGVLILLEAFARLRGQ
jgi:hypothetical protein